VTRFSVRRGPGNGLGLGLDLFKFASLLLDFSFKEPFTRSKGVTEVDEASWCGEKVWLMRGCEEA